ncbi:MAG: DUF1800 domain-containing protein [Cyclobacteriaceae bacterium]
MKLSQKEARHIYQRAGFGVSYSALQSKIGLTAAEVFQEIKHNSSAVQETNAIGLSDRVSGPYPKGLSTAEQNDYRVARANSFVKVNLTWLRSMFNSKSDLREKMTVFWHDHFAFIAKNPYLCQDLLNTIRKYALGDFRSLLTNVSKHPAMLEFLDNQRNNRDAPNENFAREFLELFTLGIGNYSEADIKEAARAFTGWKYKFDGSWQYYFDHKSHDDEPKTFLGETGQFTGDDIINITLNHRATAKHLATKIYLFLVSDEPDEDRIDELADTFYQRGYNIESLLDEIFMSEWFYSDEIIGSKIKSQMEYLVGLGRFLRIECPQDYPLVVMQQYVGQHLLNPPNVGGWPSGRELINSSSLFFRMKLPQVILDEGVEDERFDFLGSSDSDDFYHKIRGSADISKFYSEFSDLPLERALMELRFYVLGQEVESVDPRRLESGWFKSEGDIFVDYLKELLQLPEYQLC